MKNLGSLFFVISTLMQFGSVNPMIAKIFTCFGKITRGSSTETKITDLSNDDLYEVFKCLVKLDGDVDLHGAKQRLTLRCVCEDFKRVVKRFFEPSSLKINCKGQANIPLGDEIFKKVTKLTLEDGDFGKINIILPSNLQHLRLVKCKNFDGALIQGREKLQQLTISGERAGFKWSLLEGLTSCGELSVCRNEKFSGEELQGLTTLRKLTVRFCGGFVGLPELTSLRELKVEHCHIFNGKGLNKLINMRKLTVYSCGSKFTGKELEELASLRELKVETCHGFTGLGLKKLQKLVVIYCRMFDESCLKEPTKLNYLFVAHVNGFTGAALIGLTELQTLLVLYGNKFTGAALKGLTSLQKLVVVQCPLFNEDLDVIKELKKGGCEVCV